MLDHDDDPSPVLAQAKELRDLLCGEPPYELLSTTTMVQFAQRMAEDLVDLVMDSEFEEDPDAMHREAFGATNVAYKASLPRCLGGMRDEGGVDLVGDDGLNL